MANITVFKNKGETGAKPVNSNNLDGNFQAILEMIGLWEDTFSNTKTYAVGDKVIYNHKVYLCKTAITSAGSWDATKWNETTIFELLKNKIEKKEVWTNPNPNSDFSAQEINLDLKDAKKIEISYRNGDAYSIGIAYKEVNARHSYIGYINGDYAFIRNVYFTDNKINFGYSVGYGIGGNNSFTSEISYAMIPYKIVAYY